LHKLAVLLFTLLALLASNVEAQMCPSKTVFLRIIGYDDQKPTHFGAVQIPAGFFPGTEDQCPNKDVVAEMAEIDIQTGIATPIPLFVKKGSLNIKEAILNEDEVKLFKEKGIVNPPKQEVPKQQKKEPIVPKAGQFTANAETNTLRSPVN
jgi:hypothetical protein